jgi:4-hydroxybenzoate polyprenyltransferase
LNIDPPPLVVDLDGTLIRSDLLFQTFFAHIKHNVLGAFNAFYWLSKGKANLKAQLANRVTINASLLPYNEAVLEFIKSEKAQRPIILATASHRIYAEQIALHLNLFDRVIATENEVNLSATTKRDVLVAEFGAQGFDYIGNSHDDLIVWKASEKAYLVNTGRDVESKARALGNVEKIISRRPSPIRPLIQAVRLHQWLKNLLIFIPLLAAHQLRNPILLLQVVSAFLFFGFCASSVYLLNDLLDMEDDRHHPTKRHRAFASGNLSVKTGLVTAILLLLTAFSGAYLFLPWQFTVTLVGYYLLTLGYSLFLKRVMTADIIALAVLYTLRIAAGSFACGLIPTFWILAFSMFLFLSLALIKRYAELHDQRLKGKSDKTSGRGYFPSDLEMISSLGASSGYLSVMVLALYIQDKTTITLYRNPEIIWIAVPLLLFWISRIWMLTHRGQMHEDPVLFAIKDKASLIVGVLFALIFMLAI